LPVLPQVSTWIEPGREVKVRDPCPGYEAAYCTVTTDPPTSKRSQIRKLWKRQSPTQQLTIIL